MTEDGSTLVVMTDAVTAGRSDDQALDLYLDALSSRLGEVQHAAAAATSAGTDQRYRQAHLSCRTTMVDEMNRSADARAAAADTGAPQDDQQADPVRASDRERELACDALGLAVAEGRIDAAEHDRRAQLALAAVTRGDLDTLLGDLPRPLPARQAGEYVIPPSALTITVFSALFIILYGLLSI